jgi:hypothetical protein
MTSLDQTAAEFMLDWLATVCTEAGAEVEIDDENAVLTITVDGRFLRLDLQEARKIN